MNRFFLIVIVGALIAFPVLSQDESPSRLESAVDSFDGPPPFSKYPFTEFKAGGVQPGDIKTGFTGGISHGWNIDDRFFYAVEANYFQNSEFRTTAVADLVGNAPPFQFQEVEVEVQFETKMLTPFAQIYYETPISNQLMFGRLLAGLGYALVWSKENNFKDRIERTRRFSGLIWQASVGIGYKASKRGMLFIDFYYQNSKLRRSDEIPKNGLPTFTELDLTGIGVRAGVNFLLVKPLFF